MEVDKSLRDLVISKIKKKFKKKISKEIEDSIFRFSVEYATDNETPFLLEQIYNTKSEELINQLDKSKELVQKINDNVFKPSEIAFLKVEQLHPEKYKKIIKKRVLEEVKKQNKATTTAFQCPKCKERKTKVESKQTRRGDEPATLFIECVVCGHEWTIG